MRLRHSLADINLLLHLNIFERLLSKLLLSQDFMTADDGALVGALREEVINTRLTHLVIAFWVDEEPHVWVEVLRTLADRTYF